MSPMAPNQLKDQTSPYLLQHAYNPVRWRPWGDEAFAQAARDKKLVLLSSGYSACHWCHVMAHESFENDAIAELIHRFYVPIKLDREERPDIDAIYMVATQAMNHGRGGWPMTVWLTPDRNPVFAGTYFPPHDRDGMPGFASLLEHIGNLYQSDPKNLADRAQQATLQLRKFATRHHGSQGDFTPSMLSALIKQGCVDGALSLEDTFDTQHGGFGQAPKFPNTLAVRLLLRQSVDPSCGQKDSARHMAVTTLDAMAQGGMHDLAGGGFSRYSVDEAWRVPHFEKMLYDNALLITAYAEASVLWGQPRHAHIARTTVAFVLRELCDDEGLFFCALDADTAAGEGRFYVWQHSEALAVTTKALGAHRAAQALASLSVSVAGNWEEGLCVLRLLSPRHLDSLAQPQSDVTLALAALHAARSTRPRPATDTKILCGHNGLMMTALATASWTLNELTFLAAGLRCAEAVSRRLGGSGTTLWRSWCGQKAQIGAMLEDYAYLAEGLVALYEAGGPPSFLQQARGLVRVVLEQFTDPVAGALFDTPKEHEELIFRIREGHDGALPNANAALAQTAARLAIHLGEPALQKAARRMIGAYAAEIKSKPASMCSALFLAPLLGEDACYATVTYPDTLCRSKLWPVLRQRLELGLVVRHKKVMHQPEQVVLCRHQVCTPPVYSEDELRSVLARPIFPVLT